jgi:hypothetical protein
MTGANVHDYAMVAASSSKAGGLRVNELRVLTFTELSQPAVGDQRFPDRLSWRHSIYPREDGWKNLGIGLSQTDPDTNSSREGECGLGKCGAAGDVIRYKPDGQSKLPLMMHVRRTTLQMSFGAMVNGA